MKTIIGLFDQYAQAEACARDLEKAGYDRDHVSVFASGTNGGAAEGAGAGSSGGVMGSLSAVTIPGVGPVRAAGPLASTLSGARAGAAGGLVGGLSGTGVPQDHAQYYAEGVRRGGTLICVSADDDHAERVMDVMNRHHPVDIEDRATQWRDSGFTAGGAGRTETVSDRAGEARVETTVETRRATAATPAAAQQHLQGGENIQGGESIPVVEEELRVGKREVETGGVRVRPVVEERPVEEHVSLREEHVRVERRPANRVATAYDVGQAFQGGTIELTEHAEEAVVQKEARVVEEVVVNKEATERTETVRDTVRHTDVEVEQIEAGSAGSQGFETYENDFRTNFQSSSPGANYSFEQAKPAYRYGYDLAGRGGDWTSVESDARKGWEERNPGTWDKVKDAARFAYDRARSKTRS